MSKHKDLIEVGLTAKQQELIQTSTCKAGEPVVLSIMELEERICPGWHSGP